MRKGCAAVIVVIIVSAVIGTWYWYAPGAETKTIVPRITVIVTDETTNQPIADVMVACTYTYWENDGSWDPEGWPMVNYEIGLLLTDSKGVAVFDPPPIVEQERRRRFQTITLTAIHPRYGDRRSYSEDYISQYDAPTRLQQPVRFNKIAVENLPGAGNNWPAYNLTVWEIMSHMVFALPDYAEYMSRFNRTIDTTKYIALYRATLERTCGTPYDKIIAQNRVPTMTDNSWSPNNVKFYIEEANNGTRNRWTIPRCVSEMYPSGR